MTHAHSQAQRPANTSAGADCAPTLRLLSLGAGVQSTALLILAARGEFGPIDGAIFADTGWEPQRVYDHLDRLEREVAAPAGIPIHRVSTGNIRADALNPEHRFASMPLFIRNPDGSDGMGRRQCTNEYKLKPIQRKVRELLGAPPRPDGVPGRVPKGRIAQQWIGISADEAHRALDTKTTMYLDSRWPLLERGLTRSDCEAINTAAGFAEVAKSACIGCPYAGNRQWRDLRDNRPDEWADAVKFDAAIRAGNARATATATGSPLLGSAYLHRSRVPLDQAPIDRVTRREWADRQGDVLYAASALAIAEAMDDEDAEVVGCGPHTCRLPGDPEDEGAAA